MALLIDLSIRVARAYLSMLVTHEGLTSMSQAKTPSTEMQDMRGRYHPREGYLPRSSVESGEDVMCR